VAQVVEHLPKMHKVMSSNFGTAEINFKNYIQAKKYIVSLKSMSLNETALLFKNTW
jgi:hypothetical protein